MDYDAPGLWCTMMAYSADGTRYTCLWIFLHFDFFLYNRFLCDHVLQLLDTSKFITHWLLLS